VRRGRKANCTSSIASTTSHELAITISRRRSSANNKRPPGPPRRIDPLPLPARPGTVAWRSELQCKQKSRAFGRYRPIIEGAVHRRRRARCSVARHTILRALIAPTASNTMHAGSIRRLKTWCNGMLTNLLVGLYSNRIFKYLQISRPAVGYSHKILPLSTAAECHMAKENFYSSVTNSDYNLLSCTL